MKKSITALEVMGFIVSVYAVIAGVLGLAYIGARWK